MKRVAAYIRVSTEEQARIQEGSLTSQKNRLLEYIEFQNKREPNWGTLIDIYCDEGKSAKNMKGRPEFLRMLGDIKTGRVNLIIATELSRLNRNIKDFCEVWDLLKEHKVDLHFHFGPLAVISVDSLKETDFKGGTDDAKGEPKPHRA